MDTKTKNTLTLAAGSIAGIIVGRWATPRLGAALGFAFGPIGSIVGAGLGGMLGVALAAKMTADVDLPKLDGS